MSLPLIWPSRPRQKTFFLHIPRCAGTSIWTTLRRLYGAKHVHIVGTAPQLDQLAAKSSRAREGYSAIGGHGPLWRFGEIFGDLSSYYKIVTFRDPIDRLVSEYNYSRAYVAHPQHEVVRDESFDTFARRHPSNLQIRLLTGSADDVSMAVDLIQNFFDDWSMMSDTHEMIGRLCHALGAPPPRVERNNATPHRFARTEIGWNTRKFLKQQHAADLELVAKLMVGSLRVRAGS